MPIINNIKTILAISGIALLLICWFYISLLKSQIETKTAENLKLKNDLEISVSIANANAEAVKKADLEHKKTLEILNQVNTSLQETTYLNRALEQEILMMDEEHNAPVANVLENLRLKKFKGKQ